MENKTNDFENFSLNSSSTNVNNELLEETKKQTEKMEQANISLDNLYKLILEMKNSLTNESKPLEENIVKEEDKVEETQIPEPVNVEEVQPVVEPVEISEPTVVEPQVEEAPVAAETPVVEETPVIPETSVTPELNPVLEKTMELPQEDIVTPEENKEETIIGIDELLNSAPEVSTVETPVVEETPVETKVEEVQASQPVVDEVQPIVEPVQIEPQVAETPVVLETPVTPEVPVVEQATPVEVQPAPIDQTASAPVIPEAPVQEAVVQPVENNIEILDSAILNEASVHADGKQRALEVDNESISNKVSNQKTLINKVA